MTCKQKNLLEHYFYQILTRQGIAPKFSFIHSKYKDDGSELIQTIVTKDNKPVAVFDRVYIDSKGYVLNYEMMLA